MYRILGLGGGCLSIAAPKVRTFSLSPVCSRSFSPTGTASTSMSSYAIPPPSDPRTVTYWLAVMRYASPSTSGISVSGTAQDELAGMVGSTLDGVRGTTEANVGSEYGSPGMFKARTQPGTRTRALASGTIPRLPVNLAEDLAAVSMRAGVGWTWGGRHVGTIRKVPEEMLTRSRSFPHDRFPMRQPEGYGEWKCDQGGPVLRK